MNVQMHPCETQIPDSKIIDGYQNLNESSCTFCPSVCTAPKIESKINFLDGQNTKLILIIYSSAAVFSICLQIYRCFITDKKNK